MTKAHRDAIATGRREAAAVRRYLEWLAANAKRGRRRNAGSIRRRLHAIDREYLDATPLRARQLAEERDDLEAALDALERQGDRNAAEAGFVEYAKSYAARKGISYATFREVGVSPSILKRAGIRRSA